ncbi:MAG: hypothetical protein OXD43_08465 [Bacteroidetes bacterium]|nr:hypothetical protein [Bacteroidota bacterium]
MTRLNDRFTDIRKRLHFRSRYQLHAAPNIHWKKDRDKESVHEQTRYPWFWKHSEFTGERINNVPLTNAEKRSARERTRERT